MNRSLLFLLALLVLSLVACDDDDSSNNANNVNNTSTTNNVNNVNNTSTTNNVNNINNVNNTSTTNNVNNITGEVCDNGADDDGDGIIDCNDIDCALTPTCLDGRDHMGLSDEEWDVFIFTNIARTDPNGFAEAYLSGGNDNGAYADLMGRAPVAPLALNSGLITAAAEHSLDMATDCGMQHDSCDGTAWSDRIYSYYSGSTIAENVAWGYTSGQSVVIGWIIDEGVASLGHRQNIMSSSYDHIGIGESDNYWTQDFGAGGK